MKRFTKLVSTVLCLTLAVIMLAACGKKDDGFVDTVLHKANINFYAATSADTAIGYTLTKLTDVTEEKVNTGADMNEYLITLRVANTVKYVEMDLKPWFDKNPNLLGADFAFTLTKNRMRDAGGIALQEISKNRADTVIAWQQVGTENKFSYNEGINELTAIYIVPADAPSTAENPTPGMPARVLAYLGTPELPEDTSTSINYDFIGNDRTSTRLTVVVNKGKPVLEEDLSFSVLKGAENPLDTADEIVPVTKSDSFLSSDRRFFVDVDAGINVIEVRLEGAFKNIIGNNFSFTQKIDDGEVENGFAYEQTNTEKTLWKKYGSDDAGVAVSAIQGAYVLVYPEYTLFYCYSAEPFDEIGTEFTFEMTADDGYVYKFGISAAERYVFEEVTEE